ncbi:hypothetical protein NDJ87_07960 [Pseudomonas marginalis]|nr:hypothetical protein [Pseudomonas marginalis]MCM2376860.1 hypothetical protein [Pseudomonas marginalis]
MSNRVELRKFHGAEKHQNLGRGLPPEIVLAQGLDWPVPIDAYLSDAAKLGERYVALVYNDRSGVSENGMTVATPAVKCVDVRAGFSLVRSSGGDHYVIASEQCT